MSWFQSLTGIRESSPDAVRAKLLVDGERLTSLANGGSFVWGRLETPSLAELRSRVGSCGRPNGRLAIREVVANVQDLHADESNRGALFQVASQFNLLEMVHPSVTPEQGVGIYETDRTQGPACAIACGAGTIYRNYLVDVNGRPGQSADNQIDCLVDLGLALGNAENRLWKMRNGYALPSHEALVEISKRLQAASEAELDELRARLRVGIQWNTQVTIRGCQHIVTQVFGSALPVAYSRHASAPWEDFARLILDASYEATICAAILNTQSSKSDRVFVTLLGGGAFGNDTDWILSGIRRALSQYKDWNLDVAIVSYGDSKPFVRRLVDELQA